MLQHPRHWPRLEHLPAEVRQPFLDSFPWRGELVAWEPGFADRLPAGMRLPRLYRLAELGDDRVAVWMENVRTLDDPGTRPGSPAPPVPLAGSPPAAPTRPCWPPAGCRPGPGCATTAGRGSS